VLHRLREKLGFESDCLRRVPRLLTDELRAKRKELTELMIPYRETTRKDCWRNLVTGAESWFCFLSGPRRMWALAKDEAATQTRTDVQSKNSCLRSYGSHMGFMSSIASQRVPKSPADIVPLRLFSRFTRPSFHKGEIRMEID
jgi:hypothetical protein